RVGETGVGTVRVRRAQDEVGEAPFALQSVHQAGRDVHQASHESQALQAVDLAALGGEQKVQTRVHSSFPRRWLLQVGKRATSVPPRSTGPKLPPLMRILGIESSCDETGVALVDATGSATPRLLGHALHSQIAMHQAYGGVVPELASRDHIRRVLPLADAVLAQAGLGLAAVDAIACTRGPGLAGALLVGTGIAHALGVALGKPVIGVHHLEGHLLSPFLSADPPEFPFIALLVSGGHTQLMRVDGVGRYALLGETIDDAAGEAFDKSAKLLGLGYPGGPALARLAGQGDERAYKF